MFDSYPVDGGTFEGHRFWSLTRMDAPMQLKEIEIENVSAQSELLVWKASLYDSQLRRSNPLPHYDESKWRPVYEANDVLILENDRALPRAWLTGEAESVTSDECLRRIRGEDNRPFDPAKTAVLEIAPEALPPLQPESTSSIARVLGDELGHVTI